MESNQFIAIMRRLILLLTLYSATVSAQTDYSAFNTLSYSTNVIRPFFGIVDFNVHIPTTPNQSIVAGAHHYSYLFIYDRANNDNWLNTHNSNLYREWVMGNTIALDYRFYYNPRQRRLKKVGYITLINRLAIVNWRQTNDMYENPYYLNQPQPGDPGYDPEWDDGPGPPRWLPTSYDDLEPMTTTAYRWGFESGRRTIGKQENLFRELGVAVVFNLQTQRSYTIIPLIQFRSGF